jgi:hypothetical protein
MMSEHPASGPLVPPSSLRPGRYQRGPQRLPLSPGVLLTAVLYVLAAITVGCSSTKKATPTATLTPTVPTAANSRVTTTTAAARTATAPPTTPGGLSGTWSGQYGGAFQGTFTLTWQQSGANLSGSITLSAPAATLNITGTVEGSAIRFGTVGSTGITYSGSVSGNSMSGTYQTQAANGSTVSGPWSATKAS